MREEIVKVVNEIFVEFKQMEPPTLDDDAPLLGVGLDSLDFAVLVTRLHDRLGFDPFTLADAAYYPTTFREFVDFYQRFALK